MYIIVTSKPNEYAAEHGEGIKPVERYDYFFFGNHRATFTIGEVVDPAARVKIVDAEDPRCVNSVPHKFFGDFDDVEDARGEIQELVRFGAIDARLERTL